MGDYLALESVRFEDRLRVKFAIAPGAEKTPVPSMLLQALVENALKHGIAPRPSGGELVIRADRSKDATVIEVENSGQLGEPGASGPGGVGLSDTRAALRIVPAEAEPACNQRNCGRRSRRRHRPDSRASMTAVNL